MGVNSQGELAQAEAAFQRTTRERLMTEGVYMAAPETVFVSWDTAIAGGAFVEQNVVFAPGVAVEAGPGPAVRAGRGPACGARRSPRPSRRRPPARPR